MWCVHNIANIRGKGLGLRVNAHLYNNFVTLSAKTSLMLEVHKAGFRREGYI